MAEVIKFKDFSRLDNAIFKDRDQRENSKMY